MIEGDKVRETDPGRQREKPETPLAPAASHTDSWLSWAGLPARRGHFSCRVLHVTSGCWPGFPRREMRFSERGWGWHWRESPDPIPERCWGQSGRLEGAGWSPLSTGLPSCCPLCCFSPFTLPLFHNCAATDISWDCNLGKRMVCPTIPRPPPQKLLLWELEWCMYTYW